MLTLEAFKNARSVLQGVLRPTPLLHSLYEQGDFSRKTEAVLSAG